MKKAVALLLAPQAAPTAALDVFTFVRYPSGIIEQVRAADEATARKAIKTDKAKYGPPERLRRIPTDRTHLVYFADLGVRTRTETVIENVSRLEADEAYKAAYKAAKAYSGYGPHNNHRDALMTANATLCIGSHTGGLSAYLYVER